jgi:glucose/arabinose dehydrogenase
MRSIPAALATLVASAVLVAACTPSDAGRVRGSPAASSTSGAPAIPTGAPGRPSATAEPATRAPTAAPASPAPTDGPGTAATSAPARSIADRVTLDLAEVAGGFASPLFATGDGTGSGRLYVVQQGGVVRVIEPDGTVRPDSFLDASSRISAGGERGLLGLAFHPRYAENGRFFVDYTDRDGATVIAEMRRASGSAVQADAASERVLLRIDQPYPNHNGGLIDFGPDGFLYVGMGDGGAGGDPENRAQDPSTLLGKILRVDVDGRDPGLEYAVPADNPYVGRAGARPEIWASGLRNPWRFSFDPKTGDLWVGDVGQSAWEEIDRLTAASGGGRGADLGWRLMEGRACYDPPTGCPTDGLTMPLAVYGHDLGCAVTGGYVYRGAAQPALDGVYLFSDSCSGRIWAVEAAGPGAQEPVLLAETGRPIVSFGRGDDGGLYVVDIGGAVLRVVGTAK